MKSKRFILVIFVIFLLQGCLTIRRSDDFISMSGDTSYSALFRNNIFERYTWTTPPIGSQLLDFQKKGDISEAVVFFEGKPLKFYLNSNNEIAIEQEGIKTLFAGSQKSAGNIYYDLNVLKTKPVSVSRMVAETRFVTETVMVSRSFPVQRTRQVASYGPNGQTSWRTEFYTDYEMRMVPETRTVPKTEWVWRTVIEHHVDVPVYDYYQIPLNAVKSIYVYKVTENGKNLYYMQNPGYYMTRFTKSGIFGDLDYDVLMIDSNSNGIYFEPEDSFLINSWNPYDQNSGYRPVEGYMDNYWYYYSYISAEKFVTFSFDKSKEHISIINANQKYQDSEETGMLEITNIDSDTIVTINDEIYWSFSKTFKRKIEYGYHKLVINNGWSVPFETVFVIDQDHPVYTHVFNPEKEAGFFNFSNDVLRNWIVIVEDKDGKKKLYLNKESISLAEGEYEFTIVSGGNRISKKGTITAGETFTFDYQSEVNRQSENKN